MPKYSDINLNFTPHPISKDVTIVTDFEALKKSVKHLVFTSVYDRPFKPQLDCGLRQYLFEPLTPLTLTRIQNAIKLTIDQHEPRVELLDLTVRGSTDRNSVDITIFFRPVNVNKTTSVNFSLERTR